MKRAFLFLMVVVVFSPMMGQTKLDARQQEHILQQFNAATTMIKTLQCEFVQIKKMKLLKDEMQSTGVMYYEAPRKLCWQYNTPYHYTFVLNGNEVRIKSTHSTQDVDLGRNKMFRQITDIVLNSVTGGHLRNSTNFDVEIWKTGTVYTAKLYPKKKELKNMYRVIEIVFHSSLTMMDSIKMEELTGDTTIVIFKNIKTNTLINETIFNLR